MVLPPTPLDGIKVLEFAGLAPGKSSFHFFPYRLELTFIRGPFTGMLLADAGASVLRIDKAQHGASTGAIPTVDLLARHKASISVELKSTRGVNLQGNVMKVWSVVALHKFGED
ncbi:hypothetical protein LZL87_012970 [Fusarium oxysporum]|uniref:Isopenicillin N epimerase component 2 n=1 Tax=Fusarium oxysporum f. sp. rapae TaxID=485398 RepID=A0A8J5NZX9_FUSOX|nr:Isopenicillin N epimerase component 2 [Fusarium oxysporum f. sp. rapae]KAI7764282.1 hypothetical protein LZL87_012970 [Fusarium oxysporum]